jgi:hypothetical protein
MERSQSQDGWIEISFTPELGATPLKLISHSSKGLDIGENRRLKPAIFAAFLHFLSSYLNLPS